ncbi:MAG: hypothetical protein FWF07_01175 [Methanomassiliicoccaceae archaeon]|nr:hypothetical protein [Methanomassiliicoccaceae archaeon]
MSNKNMIMIAMLVVAALFIGGIAVSSATTDAARGDHHKECGDTEPIVTEASDQSISVGFVGHFIGDYYGEKYIGTDIAFWLVLGPGDLLNWDDIEAGYAAWNGLAIDGTSWQTSGPASFTFGWNDPIGYSDFTAGQYDSYDGGYYVDPGYAINVGFIAYYDHDGTVMSTSIGWQELRSGDNIDWAAASNVYDSYVAQGYLAPDGTVCQTSGYAPLTFAWGDQIGFSDFTIGQLEYAYNSFYIDPGYIAPAPAIEVGFIGYYVNDGKVMSTSIFWQEILPGGSIDWAAVDAEYADYVALGYLAPLKDTCVTSGAASLSFTWGDAIGYSDFTSGQLETYYGAFYVDPGFIAPAPVSTDQPPAFEIAIFKPKTGSTNDVFVNGVNVGSMKVESKTFVVDGYNIIIKLNNRGSGNDTWIYDFTYEIVKL